MRHRIVQTERFASDVAIEVRARELGVLIVLSVIARGGVSLSGIEALVRGEIERLFSQGPEPCELDMARVRLFGRMVRGFEHVGGLNSKSDALGLATIVGGTANSHRRRLSITAALQPDAVAAASRWLADAGVVLEMRSLTARSGR